MPHDAKGNLLNSGDRVVIHATVREVFPNPDYCNVTLVFDHPMAEGEGDYLLTLNAGQVEKVDAS